MKRGKIVAVCVSAAEGVPKYIQPAVTIAQFGVAGDYHCKPLRRSFSKPGTMKPNTDRHITIVASEALEYANRALGLQLGPGSLGENITTYGLGDLSDVLAGTVVSINGKPVFRVVEQNEPCHNLAPYHKHLVKKIYGKRGLLCEVIAGIGSVIRPNDEITIE
jgi:MOSC domain-containing protein YiiM